MNIISKSGKLVLIDPNIESFFIGDNYSIVAKLEDGKTMTGYDFITVANYNSQEEVIEAFDKYIVKPLKYNENTLDFRETPEGYLTKEETKQEMLNMIQEAKNWLNNLNEETERKRKLEEEKLRSELDKLEIQNKVEKAFYKKFPKGEF